MPNKPIVPRPNATKGAKVDVVIVNWNAGEQLADCLRSIAAHGDDLVQRVIVVDNGSTDGSADVEIPGIPLEIIRTGQNLGFGPACNIGAKRGTADFILLLNPDAELRAGVLARAVSHLAAPGSEDVGVVGVRLVGSDDVAHRHCARFPTWRSFVGNSLGLVRISRGSFPPVMLLEFDHLESRSVDHVMGAFYCIRRRIFEDLGGFDEAFFVYLEDLDLSHRVVQAGWRIDYLADVAAYHKQGGTSEQVKAHRLYYALQSNVVYAWKHRPVLEAALITAVTFLGEPISRMVRAAIHQGPQGMLFTAQGFGMLYRGIPDLVDRVRRARRARQA